MQYNLIEIYKKTPVFDSLNQTYSPGSQKLVFVENSYSCKIGI